jgi:hypothetical protein
MEAVSEMEEGLTGANLGGNLFKKRVASKGRGKRGAARTMVATNLSNRWIFLYGFNKNERDNVDDDELRTLKELANVLMGFGNAELAVALSAGDLIEVKYEN